MLLQTVNAISHGIAFPFTFYKYMFWIQLELRPVFAWDGVGRVYYLEQERTM